VVKIALDGREKLSTAIHEVVISICEIKIIVFYKNSNLPYRQLPGFCI
jgi:hypothetical protein